MPAKNPWNCVDLDLDAPGRLTTFDRRLQFWIISFGLMAYTGPYCSSSAG